MFGPFVAIELVLDMRPGARLPRKLKQTFGASATLSSSLLTDCRTYYPICRVVGRRRGQHYVVLLY